MHRRVEWQARLVFWRALLVVLANLAWEKLGPARPASRLSRRPLATVGLSWLILMAYGLFSLGHPVQPSPAYSGRPPPAAVALARATVPPASPAPLALARTPAPPTVPATALDLTPVSAGLDARATGVTSVADGAQSATGVGLGGALPPRGELETTPNSAGPATPTPTPPSSPPAPRPATRHQGAPGTGGGGAGPPLVDIPAAITDVRPTRVPIADDSPTPIPVVPTPIPVVPTPESAPSPTQAPPPDVVYVVRWGDSLNTIANAYGVQVGLLMAANRLDDTAIYVGQRLVIPPMTSYVIPGLDTLVWPLESQWLIQRYWYGHRAIDVLAPIDTPVVAVADGQVTAAGWNQFGYGYMVLLDHGHGAQTLYAHLNAINVSQDDTIRQGEVLGYSGNTGYSTHPHLHLELILNFQYLDPCLYLEGGC